MVPGWAAAGDKIELTGQCFRAAARRAVPGRRGQDCGWGFGPRIAAGPLG